MVAIVNTGNKSREEIASDLRGLEYENIVGTIFVQQGAIHALGTLLSVGCSEQTAIDMLASLRSNMHLIRQEAARRGIPDMFPDDQTGFF